MPPAGLELSKVTKVFEDAPHHSVVAVDEVSFSVKKGELFTLLGPSGCGKTTILRMIGGFEMPTSGDVLIDGKSVSFLPPNRRDTSMVFQSYALFPHVNIFNNIAYGLRIRKKLSRSQINEKVEQIMISVGLDGLEDRHAAQLSGGQQQRVALARALVNEPAVLLFDEPLSNLDARLRVQMREEIRRIQRRLGITSIYVTHDQEEAVCISDRIVVMRDGIIEQIGTPRDIYERPAGRFVASFFGKVNFVTADIKAINGDVINADILGVPFEITQPGHRIKEDKRVEAVLRPEAITILPDDNDGIPATVSRTIYMGSNIKYTLLSAGQEILVTAPNPKVKGALPDGTDVKLQLDAGALHLLDF